MAVASQLKSLDASCQLYFIGQKGDINAKLVEESDLIDQCFYISAGKFRRYHNRGVLAHLFDIRTNWLNFRDVFRVLRGRIQAAKVLRSLRPDVLFCKGGFVVVPVGYAAKALGIPYITHDSDTLPGLANRLISKGARYNAVVNDTVAVYPKAKTRVVGVPLSEKYIDIQSKNRAYYKKLLGYKTKDCLVFVFTGTQGARVIDDALDEVMPSILETHANVRVAHVFGRLNEHTAQDRYKKVPAAHQLSIRRLSFINNADEYIGAADVIIGRAGATSTAEFATAGRACIIIPAEQLTGGHQLENANMLAKSHAIKLVREKDLPDGLHSALNDLISSPNERKRLEQAILEYSHKDASQKIAHILMEIATGLKEKV